MHHAKVWKFHDDLKTMTEITEWDDTVLQVEDLSNNRQLWILNQCFFSQVSNSEIFKYDETIAEKQEKKTISFLKHTILITLFTDNCVGQNKNSVLIQFSSLLANSDRFFEIYHLFPERGHSFLPSVRNVSKAVHQKMIFCGMPTIYIIISSFLSIHWSWTI